MAQLTLQDGIDVLTRRATLARISCIAVIAASGAMLLGDLAQLAGLADIEAVELGPLDFLVVLSYLAVAVLFFLSVVVVSMWIYRAHANLKAANLGGLSFSPGWSVGWFFIPLANLVQPYKAMKELEERSDGSEGGFDLPSAPILGPWWACWLASNILSNISFRLPPSEMTLYIDLVSTALLIGSALLLMKIIANITEAQTQQLAIQSAFS